MLRALLSGVIASSALVAGAVAGSFWRPGSDPRRALRLRGAEGGPLVALGTAAGFLLGYALSTG